MACLPRRAKSLAGKRRIAETAAMRHTTLTVRTPAHQALVNIDDAVAAALDECGLRDGLLHLFVRHTTCGLLVNENADPDVVTDLLRRLEHLAPWHDPADRHAEGNSAAHLRSILVGCALTLPVRGGRLDLGTWQGVFLAEFDGPRTRTVAVTALPG
jgi:secondary thiamine-phosphate synthase enzyme